MKFHELLHLRYQQENDGDGSDLGAPSADGAEPDTSTDDMDSLIDSVVGDEPEADADAVGDLGEEPAPTEEGEEGEEPATAEEGTEPTEEEDQAFSDELRQNGKEKTANRFDKLRGQLSESKEQIAQLTASNEQFNILKSELFDRGGMSIEGLGAYTNLCEDIKNGDITEESIQYVRNMATMLQQKFGIDFSTVTPYDRHPDIKEAFDRLELTKEQADEMVNLREQKSAQDIQSQKAQSEQQEREAFDTAKNEAIGSITEKSNALKKSDPDFDAISKMIGTQLQDFANNNPPSQWASQFDMLYATASTAMKSAVDKRKSTTDTNVLSGAGTSVDNDKPEMDLDNFVDQLLD